MQAAFDGTSFNESTFDKKFFLENAKAIIDDLNDASGDPPKQ